MKRTYIFAIGAGAVLVAEVATAAPFTSVDPRSMAMGGAGVAVGNTATAPLFNPAMLSVTQDGQDFALELPMVGARLYDPKDFSGSVDSFQKADYVNQLQASIDAANTAATAQSYYGVADDTDALNGGLVTLSDKEVQGEAGAGLVLATPGRDFGVAVVTHSSVTAGGVFHYRDAATLATLAADVRAYADCASGNPACDLGYTYTWVDATGNVTFDPNRDLESTVDILGLGLAEVGASLSTELTSLGGLAVGFTPKFVRASIFDYTADAEQADTGDFDAGKYTAEYTNFNLDIGVAKGYGNGWRTGLVVKNLLAQEYEATRLDETTGERVKTGNVVELKPQARVGLSYQSGWSTLAMDVDLTENDAVGFEEKSRYVALGVELNAADWAQIRAGYRANALNSDRNVASLGLGLSPLGLHLDLAVAGNANEVGASAQLGFRF